MGAIGRSVLFWVKYRLELGHEGVKFNGNKRV